MPIGWKNDLYCQFHGIPYKNNGYYLKPTRSVVHEHVSIIHFSWVSHKYSWDRTVKFRLLAKGICRSRYAPANDFLRTHVRNHKFKAVVDSPDSVKSLCYVYNFKKIQENNFMVDRVQPIAKRLEWRRFSTVTTNKSSLVSVTCGTEMFIGTKSVC